MVLQSIPKIKAPEIWMMYLYLFIYLYMHEKPFNISNHYWEQCWDILTEANPTENILIKSWPSPMIRCLQKSTSLVALSTALWPGHRKRINIEHKARTPQRSFCQSHSPDILAAAVLFHLDVASCCQKPNTSWALNGFLGNIFRTFLPF